jgi:hypothetical protein
MVNKWRTNNKKHFLEYRSRVAHKHIDELSDIYIKQRLRRVFGLSCTTSKEHPELIEIKRIQLKLNRLTKKENV